MTTNRFVLLAACSAALVVGTAGCGSGDDSATDTNATAAWADDVCTSVDEWQTTLRTTADDLKSGGVSKSAVGDAADTVKSATKKLSDDLESVGKPDLAAGDEVKGTVDDLGETLKSGADKMQTAVEDVSSISGVLNAVSVVSGTLVSMGEEVSATFDKLRALDPKGELEDALDGSESCQKVKGATNGSGS